jgi:hypothetical protein
MSTNGNTPPLGIELADAALGAAFCNAQAAELVAASLTLDDLPHERQRRALSAIQTLTASRSPIDPVIVATMLGASGDDRAYLLSLPELCPLATNVRSYIEQLKQLRWRADLHRRSLELTQITSSEEFSLGALETWKTTAAPVLDGCPSDEASKPVVYTAEQFAQVTASKPDYLVYPYVVRGAITELTAMVKAGKTSLALAMCQAIVTGDEFLGHAVEQAPILYLTEEGVVSFRQSMKRVGLLRSGTDMFRVFLRQEALRRRLDWPRVGAFVREQVAEYGTGAVFVDTLSIWSDQGPESEKDAGAAMQAMAVLRSIADMGCAVVDIRHERKGGGSIGESARGSSAYSGEADILLTLKRVGGDRLLNASKRVLECVSRLADSPEPENIERIREGAGDDEHVWYENHGTVGFVFSEEKRKKSESVRDWLLGNLPADITQAVADGWATRELYERCKLVGYGRDMVTHAVDALVHEGLVKRESAVSSSGRSAVFQYLAGTTEETQIELPKDETEDDQPW